jgi:hypothetical protein
MVFGLPREGKIDLRLPGNSRCHQQRVIIPFLDRVKGPGLWEGCLSFGPAKRTIPRFQMTKRLLGSETRSLQRKVTIKKKERKKDETLHLGASVMVVSQQTRCKN